MIQRLQGILSRTRNMNMYLIKIQYYFHSLNLIIELEKPKLNYKECPVFSKTMNGMNTKLFLAKIKLIRCDNGEGNGTPLQYSCLENPWTEEPGRLQSMGSLRVRHDWATSLSLFTCMHWRRKWQPTPVFVLAWRIPGMAEPGGLPSMGLHRVRHDWSDLAAAAAATMHNSGLDSILEIIVIKDKLLKRETKLYVVPQ